MVLVVRVLDMIISSSSFVFRPSRCMSSLAVDAKERRTISSSLLVSFEEPPRESSLAPPV